MQRFVVFILVFLTFIQSPVMADEVMRLTTDDGLLANSVKSLFRDSRGLMYIGTSVGVDRYDGERIVNIRFPVDEVREQCWVSSIAEEEYGQLLVTNNVGRWRLDCRTLTMNFIPDDELKDAVEQPWRDPHLTDESGVHWHGYLYVGLTYKPYNRQLLSKYHLGKTFNSEGQTVRSFLIEPKRKFVGSKDGLFIIDEQTHTVKCLGKEGLGHPCVMGITPIGGYYVVATHGAGITLLDSATLTPHPFSVNEALTRAHVYHQCKDPEGHVWLCTTSGLFCVDVTQKTVRHFTSENSQLPHDEVFCGAFDGRGRGWFSTREGLCIYDPEKGQVSAQHIPRELAELDMLRDISWLDDSTLVFLPQHGFPVLANKNVTHVRTLHFNIQEAAPVITAFCRTDGVSFFTTEQSFYAARDTTVCRTFGRMDGLTDIHLIAKRILVDADRRLWMGCGDGLVVADIDSLLAPSRQTFPIIINQIQSEHWFTDAEVSRAIYDNRIRTSMRSADLTLHFTPLVYGYTADLRFRYRLEGHDREWKVAGHDHLITYLGLWPGRYTLNIEAIGKPEICESITIVVVPTYTLIAICLLIIAMLAALWWVWRSYRCRNRYIVLLQQKHKLEQEILERTTIATMQRQQADQQAAEEEARREALYNKSKITDSQARQLLQQVKAYMEDERPYRRQELRLSEVANAIGTNATRLSQVFNQYLGQNFYDFVNAYRIAEFKRLARDERNAHFTLTALAERAGFKRSSFFAAFRKAEGCTPTEWMEKRQE